MEELEKFQLFDTTNFDYEKIKNELVDLRSISPSSVSSNNLKSMMMKKINVVMPSSVYNSRSNSPASPQAKTKVTKIVLTEANKSQPSGNES